MTIQPCMAPARIRRGTDDGAAAGGGKSHSAFAGQAGMP